MEKDRRFQEPYEIIEKKLELAELTLELGKVTREKWEKMASLKEILKREEDLIGEIAERSHSLDVMTGGKK